MSVADIDSHMCKHKGGGTLLINILINHSISAHELCCLSFSPVGHCCSQTAVYPPFLSRASRPERLQEAVSPTISFSDFIQTDKCYLHMLLFKT